MSDFNAATATATAAASALAADRGLVYSPGNGVWEVVTLDALLDAVLRVAAASTSVLLLDGAAGTILVRKRGGTAGTDEIQLNHAGSGVGTIVCRGATDNGSAKITLDGVNGLINFGNVGQGPSAETITCAAVRFDGANASNNNVSLRPVTGTNVMAVQNLGGNGEGWFQQPAGRKRLTTSPTNATATLSSGVLSDLTFTLTAGRTYTGVLVLKCVNSTAGEGLQIDFGGGAASATSFIAGLIISGGGLTDTIGVDTTTSLTTAMTLTTMTGEQLVTVYFAITVNAGGTFIPRFAEVSHTSGTVTVRALSFMWIEDTP